MAEEETQESSKAVALKYDRVRDPAPRVVAKGKGTIAKHIIEVAKAHGIAVREDTTLVDILEKLDIDTVIPLEAYAAVAEILNYIYKANAKAKMERKA